MDSNNHLKKFIQYFDRPAIDVLSDPKPKPVLYATTNRKIVFRHSMDVVECPIGSTVRINMSSRFGDVGITDNLESDNYIVRVDPYSGILINYRDKP